MGFQQHFQHFNFLTLWCCPSAFCKFRLTSRKRAEYLISPNLPKLTEKLSCFLFRQAGRKPVAFRPTFRRNDNTQQMADYLCMGIRAYRNYESGDRFPSSEALVKIADYLSTSIDYLLGRDDFLQSLGVSVDVFR